MGGRRARCLLLSLLALTWSLGAAADTAEREREKALRLQMDPELVAFLDDSHLHSEDEEDDDGDWDLAVNDYNAEDHENEGIQEGSDPPHGAMSLDELTFDKIVSLPGHTVLVKFDEQSPVGDHETEFRALCGLIENVPGLLLGEVQLGRPTKRGNPWANEKLRQRFSLEWQELPAYLLFQGSPGQFEKYGGERSVGAVAQWVRRSTGHKIPFFDTIRALDQVVKDFFEGGHALEHVEAAERLAAHEDHAGNAKAPLYARYMRKVRQEGPDFIAKEYRRLERLLEAAEGLSPERRNVMVDKLRVLHVFDSKDEL